MGEYEFFKRVINHQDGDDDCSVLVVSRNELDKRITMKLQDKEKKTIVEISVTHASNITIKTITTHFTDGITTVETYENGALTRFQNIYTEKDCEYIIQIHIITNIIVQITKKNLSVVQG